MTVQEWPALNALVWLRLPCCGAEHPTRVEDFEGNFCVVAAPEAPHTLPVAPLGPKQGFFLGWVTPNNDALETPVVLVAASDPTDKRPLPTWTIRSIGSPETTQRRSYVRMGIESDVKLFLLEGGAPTHAKTIDVSEGGLRCEVDQWALDPGGRVFEVELPFNDKVFTLRAQAVWWGNLNSANQRKIGVKFLDVHASVGDTIRSYIFAAQIEERRRSQL